MSYIKDTITLTGITGNNSFIIPAGYSISQIVVRNTTANEVIGGLKFGTTDGATDIVLALTTGANALLAIADVDILKKVFSFTLAQTVFVNAVVSWNSANISIYVTLNRLV